MIHRPEVAVVGVSALFPGSQNAQGFWRDILAGKDLVTDVPPGHWLIEDYYDPNPAIPDKTYAKRGAFLPDVDFDPLEYGIPPNLISATDTSQLLALIVAQQVLEDASKGQFANMDRDRMSVILGCTSAQELMLEMTSRLQKPQWIKGMREAGIPEDEAQKACERITACYAPWVEATFPGLLGNVVAGRIANRFDLRGTNAVTDAACASALAAMSMGLNELYTGQSDVVICGGVDTMNDIAMYMCFSKTPALSRTGDCRPFSDDADGTLMGEGMAMIALKRLEDAERDNDRIYSVIKGLGSASDGRGPSVYAPLAKGQARALDRAYASAGYSPDTVELVEAHGTGTMAGDAAEFDGLGLAFNTNTKRADKQWCALGSVKSQIGHTKAAAGAAGMFKAVMALHHKTLPPTIKIRKPNPKLKLETSPFYLNTKARPWIRDASHPRRASVSAFGFGGSNFHVTLEEYTGKHQAFKQRTMPAELVLASGASGADVLAKAKALAAEAVTHGLDAVAQKSQLAFKATDAVRLAVTAIDAADLASKLDKSSAKIAEGKAYATPDGVTVGAGAREGKVAFLFPGQGSQYVEMGADVAMAFDEARLAWDAAADHKFGGKAAHDLAFPRPVFSDADRELQQRELTATEWAQPAIGVASLALFGVMKSLGLSPELVGGHSFGEITALVAAGALAAKDLVPVARERGERMRDAAKVPGSMLAVGKPIDEVNALVAKHKADVVVANHNHPTQVVLSGALTAIEALEKTLTAEGVAAKRLPVATAFHSPLVAPSTVPFGKFLEGIAFTAPKIPAYSNAEAAAYPADPAAIRAMVGGQIAKSVRFVEMIEAMYAAGARTFVEVGPGSVLTDLVDRILGKRPHDAVATDRKGKNGVVMLWNALGSLSAAGVALDFTALWSAYAPAKPPKKKPAMVVSINGTNAGRPYPPKNGAAGRPAPNPARAPRIVEKIVEKVVEKVVERPVAVASGARMSNDPRSNDTNLAWVHAYQEAQKQTADAHAAYQRAMAESHQSFLRTVETSFQGLAAMVGGKPMPAAAYTPAPSYTLPPAQIAAAPAYVAPAPAYVAPAPAYVAPAPAYVAPAPAYVAAAPAPVAAAPKAAPASANVDIEALMLAVVAEKTGYPGEMLGMQMELEGDLGIDSIKRVEILSTVRERAPGLPEVDANEMGKLRTLGEIVDYLRKSLGAAAPAPKAAAPSAAPVAPAASAAVDIEALMLAVVAEKTGYPGEMLGMQMELEGDLGIDSIKRVEILSTVRERAPGLPEVDANEMGKLRTLGEIVGYLRKSLGDSAPAPKAAAAPAAAPAAAGIDIEALMLAVVAEKTGYPGEMLGMQMELEGDLGIDSIKRVEILSTVRERAPGMPEVEAAEMGKLRTLGEIVDYLRKSLGGASAPAVSLSTSGTGAAPVEDHGISRFAVRTEPAAAVGLSMAGLTAGGRVVVSNDGTDLASLVTRRLGQHGVTAEVVDDVPADADVVVFLGGLRAVASVDEAVAVNREAFRAAKAVAKHMTDKGGIFVTVQDTGGDFGLSGADETRAWLAGVSALARTVAIEWPKAAVKAIDVVREGRVSDAVAKQIVDELFLGGTTREVGLKPDGTRLTMKTVAVAPKDPVATVNAKSVIVASGGARGVTAACLIALAKAHHPRIVILGRTALADEPAALAKVTDDAGLKRALLQAAQAAGRKVTPAEIGAEVGKLQANREIRQTLAAMRAAGSDVKYVPADIQDARSLNAALDTVRAEWGPVTGFVHGAGVLADKLVAEKTQDQFDRVFDTKVGGLRALLAATANDPLTFVCMFASVAARTGNLGQCDYAMANEVLNKVAQTMAKKRGILAKSIGWGPWEGGMVTPGLAKRFAEMGVALIPLDVGARMFVDEVTSDRGVVETIVGGEVGEGALGASSEPNASAEVRVSKQTHAFLADHAIGGKPVVPVVLCVEWMSRVARLCRPDLVFGGLRDVKVLRGIKLAGFDGAGDRLVLHARQLSNGSGAVLAVEVRGEKDALHYSALADMLETKALAPRAAAAAPKLSAYSGEIYGGALLFHGPAFHVIDAVDGADADGAVAELTGCVAHGWGSEATSTDPGVLDGVLQLALIWANLALGGPSLPMAVGSVNAYETGPVTGPVRCVLRRRTVAGSKGTCDATVFAADGRVLAEVRGIEVVARPS